MTAALILKVEHAASIGAEKLRERVLEAAKAAQFAVVVPASSDDDQQTPAPSETVPAPAATPVPAPVAKTDAEFSVDIDEVDVTNLFSRVTHEGRVLRFEAEHAFAARASKLIADLDGHSVIEAVVDGALVRLRAIANRTVVNTAQGVMLTVGSHHDVEVTE